MIVTIKIWESNEVAKMKQKIVKGLTIGAIVLCLLGTIFMGKGFFKKNLYSISDDLNVYVGGDAYNYQINASYFVGYMVLATGCFTISTMLGMSILYIKLKDGSIEDTVEEMLPSLD